MTKPDQIAYQARAVSKAKTSLLRLVVSERMNSTKPETKISEQMPQEARKTK
ncbi:MAG: hypothetical protein V7664_07860 [Qipengyuania sp.]|uniref:hypothetical protein n=1 Tax=Qipengyuania sp. TaxID=2004515 RepID=UPI0030018019